MESPRARTALVTGAAGFIGRSLCRRLVQAGVDVVGVDIVHWAEFPGALWLDADVAELEPADLKFDSFDEVFHLPAVVGVAAAAADDQKTTSSILRPLERVLALNDELPFGRFVFVSSSEVYGEGTGRLLSEDSDLNPLSAYGLAKKAGEARVAQWSKSSGTAASIVRPFNVYGPEQRSDFVVGSFVRAALEGRPLRIVGDGAQTRTLTYIDDLVDGMLVASQAASIAAPLFNIAGSQAISILDLAHTVVRLTGSTAQIEHVDAAVLNRPLEIEIRDRKPDRRRADHAGFSPQADVESGLTSVIEHVRTSLAGVS